MGEADRTFHVLKGTIMDDSDHQVGTIGPKYDNDGYPYGAQIKFEDNTTLDIK